MKQSKIIQCGIEYITATVDAEYFTANETETGKAETRVSIYATRGGIDENFFSMDEAKLVLTAWQELLAKVKANS